MDIQLNFQGLPKSRSIDNPRAGLDLDTDDLPALRWTGAKIATSGSGTTGDYRIGPDEGAGGVMPARKLPDFDTLIRLRRTHTLKEIGAMYGATGRAVSYKLAHAEALMRETKRLAWAAWDEKQRKG